jgi:hypothetical protein
MAGLAAAAISAAPLAGAAANPSTTISGDRTTITDKQGHTAIVVQPPNVSTANSYGPFSSAWPIMMFD